jgi:acyl-CoA reductase-like NAD-dependent aldehyde dehydrogenase
MDIAAQIAADIAGLGQVVNGRITTDGTTFDVVSPSTGEFLAACPAASVEMVDEAVAAARAALPSWASDEALRRKTLLQMADALDGQAEVIGRVLAAESGKLLPIATGEVHGAAVHLRWYAEQELPVDVIADDGAQRVQVVRDPVGVVAAITPWNAPVIMLANKVGASLLAGDTVVAKPSPFTPLSSLLTVVAVNDLLPPGVLNILAGGDDVGAAMTRHPGVDMVAFTGSVAAGKAIMAAGAPTLKRMLLELGGNDAAIVLDDADIDAIAAKLYRGAFALSGQICAAIKRLYVHESKFDEVVDRMTELAGQARVGGAFEEGATMGPLATKPQFDRVVGLVADALANGGTAVTGGAPLDRPGYFYPPTIVTGVGKGVALVDEEQFGPALPIMRFSNVDDVIAEANGTDLGLGGSIWTSDVEHGVALARRLRSGSAWVNRHPAVGPSVPFGGAKQSGVGREGGAVGVDAFCELKTVSVALS